MRSGPLSSFTSIYEIASCNPGVISAAPANGTVACMTCCLDWALVWLGWRQPQPLTGG